MKATGTRFGGSSRLRLQFIEPRFFQSFLLVLASHPRSCTEAPSRGSRMGARCASSALALRSLSVLNGCYSEGRPATRQIGLPCPEVPLAGCYHLRARAVADREDCGARFR